jgi:nucleoside 2-deoxyribosyltransferase
MNIYFAGAIRGGRSDAELYLSIIRFLRSYGTVLTEHVGNEALLLEEQFLSEGAIFKRDMEWLAEADLVIAEVSTPSLGVGYELAVAEQMNIPCFCLFRQQENQRLSAMLAGNPFFQLLSYHDFQEVKKIISHLMEQFAVDRTENKKSAS